MTGGTVIHVGAAPASFRGLGHYLDGQSAEMQPATLRLDEATASLMIHLPDGDPVPWRLAEIRQLPDQADPTRPILALAGGHVARLILEDRETARLLRARCPNLGKRPKPKGLGRLLGWAVAAVGAVALIVAVLVPLLANQLATVLPPEGEAALGDATLEQVRRALDRTGMNPLPICDASEGTAALDEMTARLLQAADLPSPPRVTVLDHPLINAFALPGGRVVLFRGLLDAAEDPDEVAAVLAHEIGHVANRDPTRIALRSAGSIGVLGLLFGDFAGGAAVLFLTERIIQASYTQTAEAAADDFALDLLTRAEIDSGALGRFFARLAEKAGDPPDVLAHFQSHPELGDRIAKAAAAPPSTRPRSSLSTEDWEALQQICNPAPEVP